MFSDPTTTNGLLRTRRHFFRDCQFGVGSLALSSLLAQDTIASKSPAPLEPRDTHFEPKAKSVIFLHMAGSPPHLDLFDYKPELVKRSGQDCPDDYLAGRQFAFTTGVPKLLGTPRKFKQHGKSGTWMSDAMPQLSKCCDDIAMIKSMHTEQFNHAPAQLMLYTGSPRVGRPSLGSWVTYGIGSPNQNLPGFVVLISGGTNPSAGKRLGAAGFSHPFFRVCNADQRVIPCSTYPTRLEWTEPCEESRSMLSTISTKFKQKNLPILRH